MINDQKMTENSNSLHKTKNRLLLVHVDITLIFQCSIACNVWKRFSLVQLSCSTSPAKPNCCEQTVYCHAEEIFHNKSHRLID